MDKELNKLWEDFKSNTWQNLSVPNGTISNDTISQLFTTKEAD